MSAEVISALAPEPVGVRPRAARPRMHLVGPDERVCGDGPACTDGQVWTAVDPAVEPAARLTRRGHLARIVLGLAVACTVAALAVVLATSVDAAAPQIDHATTVSAGQTLSDVAAAQLPNLPIRDGVARIQLVNGLNSSQVHAGQSLLIPVVP